MNLAAILDGSAAKWPDKPGLVAGPSQWSYASVAAASCRAAAYLRSLGLGRGDRVALMAYNTPEGAVSLTRTALHAMHVGL